MAPTRPTSRPVNDDPSSRSGRAPSTREPRGSSLSAVGDDRAAMSPATRAEIAALRRAEDVDHRLHVVVRHDRIGRPRASCWRGRRAAAASPAARPRDRERSRSARQRVDRGTAASAPRRVADARCRVQPERRRRLAAAGEMSSRLLATSRCGQADACAHGAVRRRRCSCGWSNACWTRRSATPGMLPDLRQQLAARRRVRLEVARRAPARRSAPAGRSSGSG